ncbi:MAG: hypothetical protein IH602_10430 [Bryobacteraceae bacterium]|nr:hypothetical protein [Bryobacteraceae bacterium]
MNPSWLPPMVSVNGDAAEVFAMLYRVFSGDFRGAPKRLSGLPVWWDRRIADPPYEEGFWHLITRLDKASGVRLLDPRRAERLPWCGPVIANSTAPEVAVWDYEEGSGRVRTYVWLLNHDYLVVLEKRQKRIGLVAFLVTAFHIDGPGKRADLEKKLARRVA